MVKWIKYLILKQEKGIHYYKTTVNSMNKIGFEAKILIPLKDQQLKIR